MANHGRLPNEEWLHLAKRCSVGEQARYRHLREGRDNLIVGNKDDRWWAYCQACKRGAVEQKSHVLLVPREPEKSRDLSLPLDLREVSGLPGYQQEYIANFLAAKHMDLTYLPANTCWSESRQRLLVPHLAGAWDGERAGFVTRWMGRDTSGHSPQKWLTYNGQHYIGQETSPGDMAILVEDPFSWFKVRWALRGDNTDVYCTLGTAIHDTLFLHLLQHYTTVVSFYDGDPPGWAGCGRNGARLSGAGIGHWLHPHDQCAPEGLDPKDMSIDQIGLHVTRLYSQIK